MGRTGKLWAAEHFGVQPDLILSAKSIAAGVPLSAVIGKAEIMDRVPDSGIGGTYPGNPLACEAAHAVLDAFEAGLLERACEVGGDSCRWRSTGCAEDDPGIGDSRGLGPMRALEFVQGRHPQARRRARRRDPGARGGARPADAQGGRRRQLHPRARAAGDHRCAARRVAGDPARGDRGHARLTAGPVVRRPRTPARCPSRPRRGSRP